MRTALSEHSFLAVCLAAALLGTAFLTTNTFSQATRTGKATPSSPVRVADARAASLPAGKSLAEFEDRMAAALAAAEAALASEEARLDGLAERHSHRTLADGRPSVAQAAANARLWDRRIREMETAEHELLDALKGTLTALGADIASLTQRLSAQGEKAKRERIAREKAQRERAQREREGTTRRARGFIPATGSACSQLNRDPSTWSKEAVTMTQKDNGRWIYTDEMLCYLNWYTAHRLQVLLEEFGDPGEYHIHDSRGRMHTISAEECIDRLDREAPYSDFSRLCNSFHYSWKEGNPAVGIFSTERNFHPVDGLPDVMRYDLLKTGLPLIMKKAASTREK